MMEEDIFFDVRREAPEESPRKEFSNNRFKNSIQLNYSSSRYLFPTVVFLLIFLDLAFLFYFFSEQKEQILQQERIEEQNKKIIQNLEKEKKQVDFSL